MENIFEEFSYSVSPQDFALYLTVRMYPQKLRRAIFERKCSLELERHVCGDI